MFIEEMKERGYSVSVKMQEVDGVLTDLIKIKKEG